MASSPRTQTFSEPEQRFLVAEVIKNSSISLNKLISIVVADELGQPNWDDMLVPHGRTVAQCKDALRSLRSMAPTTTFGPVSQLPPAAATSNKRKSDQSFDQPIEQAQRRQSGPHQNLYNIQPRPSPTYSPRSQASFAQPPAAPPAKKRGRPSKAESERKHREAIERGEVIASISPRGGPGTSEGPSYQAIAPAPPDLSQAGVAVEPQPLRLASAESPDRRKRPKTAKPVKQEHMTGQGFFHSNPTSKMGPGEQRGFSTTVFESTPASPVISSTGGIAPQSPYSVPPQSSNSIPPTVSAPATGPLPPIQPEPKT